MQSSIAHHDAAQRAPGQHEPKPTSLPGSSGLTAWRAEARPHRIRLLRHVVMVAHRESAARKERMADIWRKVEDADGARVRQCAAILRRVDPERTAAGALKKARALCHKERVGLTSRIRYLLACLDTLRAHGLLALDDTERPMLSPAGFEVYRRIAAGEWIAADDWRTRVAKPTLSEPVGGKTTGLWIDDATWKLMEQVAEKETKRRIAKARDSRMTAALGSGRLPLFGEYRQEALMKMRNALPTYDESKGTLEAFLRKVARNAITDVYDDAVNHPLGIVGLPTEKRSGRRVKSTFRVAVADSTQPFGLTPFEDRQHRPVKAANTRQRVRAVKLDVVEMEQAADWSSIDAVNRIIDVRRKLERLPPRPRAVLELLISGYSVNEAAVKLGISRERAQAAAHAARSDDGPKAHRRPQTSRCTTTTTRPNPRAKGEAAEPPSEGNALVRRPNRANTPPPPSVRRSTPVAVAS